MKNKFTTILIAVLVLLNVVSLYYGQTNAAQTEDLQKIVAELPKEPIVYVGKDGKVPQEGIDYVLPTPKDGINAISFNTTVVKEVPLMGIQGVQGISGRTLQSQFNETTGNFEQKYSDETLWEIKIPCSKFVSGCPALTESPAGDSGGLGSE